MTTHQMTMTPNFEASLRANVKPTIDISFTIDELWTLDTALDRYQEMCAGNESAALLTDRILNAIHSLKALTTTD